MSSCFVIRVITQSMGQFTIFATLLLKSYQVIINFATRYSMYTITPMPIRTKNNFATFTIG